MAPSGRLPVGRYFLALIVLVIGLYSLVFFTGKGDPLPRLGLDLVGGTTMTLSARTTDGKPPDQDKLELARQIIENRVNGLGVGSPEVVTEGNENIVVTIAGESTDAIDQIGQPAQLRFRKVLTAVPSIPEQPATPAPKPSAPAPSSSPSAPASPSASASPAAANGKAAIENASASTGAAVVRPAADAPSPTPTPAPKASAPVTKPKPQPAPKAAAGDDVLPKLADVEKRLYTLGMPKKYTLKTIEQQLAAIPMDDPQTAQQTVQGLAGAADLMAFKKLTPAEIAVLPNTIQLKVPQISCKKLGERPAGVTDDPKAQVVGCDENQKYLMDIAKVLGTDVSSSTFEYSPGGQGSEAGWRVILNFKSGGQDKWTNLTKESVNKQVAIVLDNKVVSAPNINQVISGQAEITGGFTKESAQELANQLKFGALPVSFKQQNAQKISATLGLEQLKAGLLAGAIGLALVFIYVLVYYRLLGLVTIASLVLSVAVVYAVLVLLGRPNVLGFTLTLAGIAGFIVSVGITADSFVIFFERLKDEIKEGRSARSAVPRAWARARKTIISADTVTFLAAVVLYVLAAGEVRGFAFTLGMSTVLDLLVVFLFTHPVVSVMSRYKAFMSPRVSGLGQSKSEVETGKGSSKLLTKGA